MKRFKLDFSFLIFLIFLFLSPKQYLILKLFLCLVLHELGHITLILLFRYPIARLRISVFGFFLELDQTKEFFHKDFLIYLGGILTNLICYIFIPDLEMKRISLFLIGINALPIYPLDGFNALKTLISYLFPYYYTSKGMVVLSLFLSGGLLCLGLVQQMDLYLIFSFGYLLFLNLDFLKKQKILFKKFLIHKALYRYSYPIKKIKFHEKYLQFLYKYHEIEIHLNQKVITEVELLQMEKLL